MGSLSDIAKALFNSGKANQRKDVVGKIEGVGAVEEYVGEDVVSINYVWNGAEDLMVIKVAEHGFERALIEFSVPLKNVPYSQNELEQMFKEKGFLVRGYDTGINELYIGRTRVYLKKR